MFIRESGLMLRTFAQFIFKMTFSRGAGGCEIPEGWGGGSYCISLCGRGMDIFWNHTISIINDL